MTSTALSVVGMLHFLQIPSMLYLVRGTLDLASELGRLSAINRRLYVLFVLAVAFLLLGVGALVALHPSEFLGTSLGRRLCLLLALFWALRASAQAWLARVWPRGIKNRALLLGLFALYLTLAVAYGLAASAG